jgi:ribosomal protein S18 acetylase RimI-like enzyme
MMIRSATRSDIPNLLPLIAKICELHKSWDQAKYGFLPDPERSYERWLSRLIRDQRNLCLVAEVPDEKTHLAGFLIATVEQEIPIYSIQEYGFVHDLWVEPEYRQAGLARQMVVQTIAHFSQLGIQQIRLDTAAPNEAARRLLMACGFRVSTIEMLIEID